MNPSDLTVPEMDQICQVKKEWRLNLKELGQLANKRWTIYRVGFWKSGT